ncbi:2-oxoacid:acceptor oxidoreductase family protein [Carboxydocella sp. ULO1]|uniref:2-oxoacid:acceptor oxidoreductase family protein n=1 Tax=Carboxydocella sp. ULO1 TaxID=1926599 RepID=UPI0009ADC076|nr:2-oxoacid:acceptor oxidoreductase family protein [Carboxydocella sp. ULO1]GAW29645.1 2-oxoglutarate ferredoxin oxidoreductase subunit gamma [Carboxydocella sp. ULO1]
MLKEFRLSGTGGQGIILAAILLAEGATRQGLNVVQTESYGPEARGGASKAEVKISDEPIDYPKVEMPELLLALSQEAYDKYHNSVQERGIIIVDEDLVPHTVNTNCQLFKIPFTRLAKENIGKEIVTNIVALGAIAALTKELDSTSILEALQQRIPSHLLDINLNAYNLGYKQGVQAYAQSQTFTRLEQNSQ